MAVGGVDAFLVIVVIVMAVLLGVAVVLLMIKFGHPDDKNVAKFPKVVTVRLFLLISHLLLT